MVVCFGLEVTILMRISTSDSRLFNSSCSIPDFINKKKDNQLIAVWRKQTLVIRVFVCLIVINKLI
jgi:hypothetical protein